MKPIILRAAIVALICAASLWPAGGLTAATTITNTRDEVNFMATLWETDTLNVSGLADAQYPQFSGQWDYIFPHTAISGDGDVHTDMAVDAAGTGKTGNNTGESPIICEVSNANSTQLNHLKTLTGQRAIFRGIFRFYTEHASERHFELHPVTQLQTWNGAAYAGDSDYHANIATVSDGATHAMSTYVSLLNGSETMTAAVASDNVNVTFTYPSPSVNYVQYDGTALSGLQADSVSPYFLFRPNLVPAATVRCRVVANTAAAATAATLAAAQSLTVNALNRTDMAAVASRIAPLAPGQAATFARPVEFILLGIPAIGPSATPMPSPTPTATPTPSPTPAAAELLNISTRGTVQTGDKVLIGGFIVKGSLTRRVLLRARGPSLTAAGVSNALADPTLGTFDANGPGAANDDWKDVQQTEIAATGLAPSDDRESALLTNYGPNNYTAIVSGKNGTTGIGLFEAYVLDQRSDTQVVNISTRGFVGTGDQVLIGGFIIGGGGGGNASVIIRAIGPSLANSGVADALPDTVLQLFDGNGALVAANDNWQDDPRGDEIEADGLAPLDARESATLQSLAPGAYTAIVRGAGDTTGVGLVEVYYLQ